MDPLVKSALASGEWVEKTDPKSGKVYYYNKTTKKTTWDLAKDLKKEAKESSKSATPVETPKPQPQAAAASSGVSSGGKTLQDVLAEGEWVEKTDPKSGKVYFSNKKTKKTTWDLAKELGLASPTPTPTPSAPAAATPASDAGVAAATSATPGGSDPLRFRSVAEALASGEWVEKTDSKSGKVYFSHKATKTTTWDLAKELAKAAAGAPAPGSTGAAGSQHGAPSNGQPKARPKKNYDAKVALASGEWEEVRDYMGRTFYVHRETRQSTGDLQLYLKIQEAIDEGDDDVGELNLRPLPGFNAAGISGAAARAAKESDPTRLVPDVDDWVNVMLRAPGHPQAAARILAPEREQLQRAVLSEAETLREQLAALERRSKVLEQTAAEAQAIVQRQKEEIHQLHCALFYGITPPSSSSGSRLAIPPPPGLDATELRRGTAHALEERVEYMQRTITDLQGHNRMLQFELEQERLRKHEASECAHCTRADPWRRLMDVTASPTRRFA